MTDHPERFVGKPPRRAPPTSCIDMVERYQARRPTGRALECKLRGDRHRRREPLHPLRRHEVHRLRALHPLLRGGRGGQCDHADRARQPHHDLDRRRPVAARHDLRALRRLHRHLPDRRDGREDPAGDERQARARAEQGAHDLQLLRRGLPDGPQRRPRGQRRARQGRQDHEPAPGHHDQRRQPVRQGPLRLRLHRPRGPAHHTARPRPRMGSCARPRGPRRFSGPPRA